METMLRMGNFQSWEIKMERVSTADEGPFFSGTFTEVGGPGVAPFLRPTSLSCQETALKVVFKDHTSP